MARAARIYDFTLTAGGSFNLLVEGSYYRILTSTGAIEVRRGDGSVVGPLLAGQGEQNQEFTRLTLIDKSGSGNVGTLVVADGTFVDARTTGEVSVIDGELARSKAGNAFMAIGNVGPIAAQFSYLELWNPAGSGKRVIVSDLMMSTNINSEYQLQRTTVLIFAATGAPSKSSAGAVSSARYSGNTTVAVSGSALEVSYLLANSPVIRSYKQPLVIEPNSGLALFAGVVNIPLRSSFQFTEEAL